MYYCKMYSFETKLRVRYAETDQMSYVYYGIYAQYYEVGRVELLRSLGISYKSIELMGYALPVVNLNINYKQPAYYDQNLLVKTTISKMPTSRIVFNYEMFNENSLLINNGQVTLAFINKKTGKVCVAPEFVIKKLEGKLL